MSEKLDLDALERGYMAGVLPDLDDMVRLFAAARRLEQVEGAILFIAFSPTAALEWNQVDTLDEMIALAKKHGWDPKSKGGE